MQLPEVLAVAVRYVLFEGRVPVDDFRSTALTIAALASSVQAHLDIPFAGKLVKQVRRFLYGRIQDVLIAKLGSAIKTEIFNGHCLPEVCPILCPQLL